MPADDQRPDLRELARNGEGTEELLHLRARLRYVAAFTLIAGLAVDRIGPAVSDRWQQLTDVGLLLVIAAILVLLGERGISAAFERWIQR